MLQFSNDVRVELGPSPIDTDAFDSLVQSLVSHGQPSLIFCVSSRSVLLCRIASHRQLLLPCL